MKLTSLKTNKEHSSTVDSEYVKNSIHNMNFFSTNVTLRKGGHSDGSWTMPAFRSVISSKHVHCVSLIGLISSKKTLFWSRHFAMQ